MSLAKLQMLITVTDENGTVLARKFRDGLSDEYVAIYSEDRYLGAYIAGAESSAKEAIRDAFWALGYDPHTGQKRSDNYANLWKEDAA